MDDDEPPGVPEWVVTYGDMMSLLLTFFIMLVSLSEVVADNKYRAIIEALRQYMGYNGAPEAPPGKNFPLNSVLESLQQAKLGSVSDDSKGAGGVKQQGTPAQDLQIVRLKEGKSQPAGPPILFSSGKAMFAQNSKQQVQQISREVAGKPHKLEIRAFSSRFVDGIPQTSDQRMELSYLRADLIMKQMVADGVEANRMRIAVYFHDPNEALGSRSNQPQDRVEVTILDQYADTFIGREADYR